MDPIYLPVFIIVDKQVKMMLGGMHLFFLKSLIHVYLHEAQKHIFLSVLSSCTCFELFSILVR